MSYKLLIDGKLVDGASEIEVINPSTGEVFASCARADEAQLDQAVAAAKAASNSLSAHAVWLYGDTDRSPKRTK